MATELNCSELGVVGCNQTFQGETPGDVLDELRDHVESEHGVDLPNNEVILQSGVHPTWEAYAQELLAGGFSEDTVLLVRRIREALDVGLSPE